MFEKYYPFINNYPVIPSLATDSETFSISLLLQDDVFLTKFGSASLWLLFLVSSSSAVAIPSIGSLY